MAKIGNNSTTFRGVEEDHCAPRSYIYAEDVGTTGPDGVMQDQAYCYQYLTGKQLDDASAWAGSEQVHDGTNGAPLGHPLSYAGTEFGDADSTSINTTTKKPVIYTDTITNERIVYRWPVFIPAGHSQVYVRVHAQLDFLDYNPQIVKSSTSFVEEAERATGCVSSDADKARGWFWFRVAFDNTSQVYVLDLRINLNGQAKPAGSELRIGDVQVLPLFWQRQYRELPEMQANTAVGTYTPLIGSSFTKVEEAFAVDNRPLSSYLTHSAALNDGYLHELVTGMRVPGDASTTTDGHNHTGVVPNGSQIDLPMISMGLGSATLDAVGSAATSPGFYYATSSQEADYIFAPTATNNESDATPYEIVYNAIRLPSPGGNRTLRWCAITFQNGDYGVSVRLGGAGIGSFGTWSTSAYSASTATGWNYHSGTLTLTGAAFAWIKVDLAPDSVAGSKGHDANMLLSCTGFACWVD